jgi:hypothetical protein
MPQARSAPNGYRASSGQLATRRAGRP